MAQLINVHLTLCGGSRNLVCSSFIIVRFEQIVLNIGHIGCWNIVSQWVKNSRAAVVARHQPPQFKVRVRTPVDVEPRRTKVDDVIRCPAST